MLSHALRSFWLIGIAAGLATVLSTTPCFAAHGSVSVSIGPSAVRGAPPTVSAPVSGKPRAMLRSKDGDLFVQATDGTVRALSSGDAIIEPKPDKGEHVAGSICSAGTEGYVACLVKFSDMSQPDRHYSRLVVVDSKGKTRRVASAGDKDLVVAEGILVDKHNAISLLWYKSQTRGKRTVSKHVLVTDGNRIKVRLDNTSLLGTLAQIGGGERHDPPVHLIEYKYRLYMVYRSGQELTVQALGSEPVVVASSSLHDIRPVVTPDGWFTIFYHNPKENSMHAAVSKTGKTWRDIPVDGKESGWQLEAASKGNTVTAVYYYYRNSYNKGLRVATFRGGRMVGKPFTLVREHAFNTGWKPLLGIAGDGTTWLSYLHNVEADERVWSKFENPGKMRDYQVGESGTWEDNYKDYFLQAGIGGWLNWWMLGDSTPKDMDAVKHTSYTIGRTILAAGSVEARWGSYDVGMRYAQDIADKVSQEVKDKSDGVLDGSIQVDQVFAGHDFQLSFLWGRYHGTATPGEGVDGDPMELSTSYVDTQIMLLNKWRIKYGLGYTNYRVPASVHAFTARKGSTTFSYEGSYLRDVTVQDFSLLIGYSKLDYSTKYENHYNGFIVDASGGLGLSTVSFSPVSTSLGDVDSAVGINFKFRTRLGWLYFHRWESLGGMGLYVRPAYTAEIVSSGTGREASSRKSKDADDDAVKALVGLNSLRHGPWLDVGAVW